MKLWKVMKDKINNISLLTEEKEDYKLNDIITDGHSLLNEWDSTLEVFTYRKNVEYSDVVLFYDNLFTVTEKALKVFMKMVPNEIECLHFNLIDSDEKYTVVNPIDIVDCIDMKNSEYKVYKGDPNTIQFFKKVCIKKDAVYGKHFFRVARCDANLFLCSDEFKEAMEDADIKGILFELFAEI